MRTGTFGAAAMIYAARSLGLGSTPMIGFDAEAVHGEFGLAANEVPVMLLSVGAERPGKLGAEAAPARGRCPASRLNRQSHSIYPGVHGWQELQC